MYVRVKLRGTYSETRARRTGHARVEMKWDMERTDGGRLCTEVLSAKLCWVE